MRIFLYFCRNFESMAKKNLPVIENVTITGVAAEGKALVRINDIVTFVPNCVPGDIVDLQITKKKHSFMEARVLRVVQPSAVRCEARCPHFGVCGGCKWQILPYEEQIKYKQQQIVDNLTRIGKIELPEISPILGSKHIYEYRNKLEFTCSDRKWFPWEVIEAAGGLDHVDSTYGLGFHIPNAFDKVLDIEQCHLMPEINNRIRNSVRAYARAHGMTFYNEHTHEGLLRTLILRNNHKGELMLIDMGEMSYGHPLLDLGHARSAMYDFIGNYEATIGLPRELGKKVWLKTLDYYFKDLDAADKAHRCDQIHVVAKLRNFTWLSLSDSFPQEVIRECQEAFKERVLKEKDFVLDVCKTFNDWQV